MEYGVIQGRLVPQVGDFVQNFPTKDWMNELIIASNIGCDHVEWIITDESNPLLDMALEDFQTIKGELGIKIDTVCYDHIMSNALFDLKNVELTCQKLENLGIQKIVIPLLDGASVQLFSARKKAIYHFSKLISKFSKLKFSFETDLNEVQLISFIRELEVLTQRKIGITLDTGNLLKLGYDIRKHVDAYCDLIDNIHIKDATRGDRSVHLGTGDLDGVIIRHVMKATRASRVTFQTARSMTQSGLQTFFDNKSYMEILLNAKP